MKRNTLAIVALVALATLLTHGISFADGGKGKGKGGNKAPGAAKVEGRITAVGTSTVSIQRQNGTVVTVNVVATTKIERNGRHVALSAFKVGDRGQALYNATTFVASKVEAVGP